MGNKGYFVSKEKVKSVLMDALAIREQNFENGWQMTYRAAYSMGMKVAIEMLLNEKVPEALIKEILQAQKECKEIITERRPKFNGFEIQKFETR